PLPLLCFFFFFSSRRRHTISKRDWSSDVCSSDLIAKARRAWVPVSSVARSVTRGSMLSVELEGQELLDVLIAHPLPEYLVMDVGGGVHGVLRAVDVTAAMAGRR